MASAGLATYDARMPTKKIQRLKPYNQPPSEVGTTILDVWNPGAVKASHIFPEGRRVIWPNEGVAIGPDGQEATALRFLTDGLRDYIGDTIYVVGDPDA
jgi:nucleoid-associated protein YgaU